MEEVSEDGSVCYDPNKQYSHAEVIDIVVAYMRSTGETEKQVAEVRNTLVESEEVARQTLKNFITIAKQNGTLEADGKFVFSATAANKRQIRYAKRNAEAKTAKSEWTYKKLRKSMMGYYENFIRLVNGDETDGWDPVDLGENCTTQLWEQDKQSDDEETIYVLKVKDNLPVKPERIVKLMTDTDFQKRMRWDPDNLCSVNVSAEDGSKVIVPGLRLLRAIVAPAKNGKDTHNAPINKQYRIVECYLKPPSVFMGIPIPGVAIRRYITSQWCYHDENNREYIILTHSIEDPRFPLFQGMVDATGFGGLRIQYDEKRTKCVVTMVGHINPGGNIPASIVKWGKTQLADLLKKIKKGCDDPLYTDVYGEE